MHGVYGWEHVCMCVGIYVRIYMQICVRVCMYICIAYAYCYLLAPYHLMHTEYAKKFIYYSPLTGFCVFTMTLTVAVLPAAVTRKFSLWWDNKVSSFS